MVPCENEPPWTEAELAMIEDVELGCKEAGWELEEICFCDPKSVALTVRRLG